MSNEIVLRKIRALGIPDPMRVTAQTVKLVVAGYLTKKAIDGDTFRAYMGMVNPSLYCLMEGLKSFSLDQSGISHKVQNTVELAVDALKARLATPNLSEQEARDIRYTILELVREAREEANEQRILTVGLAAFATTAFVALMGGALAILESKKSAPRRFLLNDR
jgi:hypothetical protein